jgi:hypothetical protein
MLGLHWSCGIIRKYKKYKMSVNNGCPSSHVFYANMFFVLRSTDQRSVVNENVIITKIWLY